MSNAGNKTPRTGRFLRTRHADFNGLVVFTKKIELKLTAERERRVRAEAALRNAPTIYADHRDISQWLEEHAAAIAAAKDEQ